MSAAPTLEPQWQLDALLRDFVAAPIPPLDICGVTLDSRKVSPGSLFLACAGTQQHGLRYAADAVAAGAAAVLWEPAAEIAAPQLPVDAVAIPVPDLTRKLGLIADRFYYSPSRGMHVAGVTGTNGKSSTVHMLVEAAERLGRASAMVGTIGNGRPGALTASALTTPNALQIHALLADFLAAGIANAALEVSSHAMEQGRVQGVHFDTAVFTNLSRDHLDYHGNMDEYGAAKARLFAQPGLRHAVVNTDDAFGAKLMATLPDSMRTVAVGARVAEWAARDWLRLDEVGVNRAGIRVSFSGSLGEGRIDSALLGRFNAENLLAALAVLVLWGADTGEAAAALGEVTAPCGRMEAFGGVAAPLVIVDYAHTPDALAHALRAIREHTTGKLWCVFGCGGDRDRGKRPQMGAIAARHADRVFITDDNPRTEAPQNIVADIRSGMPTDQPVNVERDRQVAIAMAIGAAGPDDTVLVAGKGHEEYQLVGTQRMALSDRDEVRQALEKRA